MWFAGLEVHVKYDKKEALQGSLFHSSLHCPGDKKEPANLEKKKLLLCKSVFCLGSDIDCRSVS